MSEPIEDQRQWLEDLLAKMHITPSELARRAKLNPSTITRFLNRQGGEGHTLTFRTIHKIEQATGSNRPAPQSSLTGMSERNAALYDLDTASTQQGSAVRALIGNRNATDPWEILNDELSAIGIFTGDILIVDLNEVPVSGDIVCAQLYEPNTTRTVFRLWEPPFLLTGSTRSDLRRPVVVDNSNAMIRGTVIARISPRFSNRAAA